jgi:acyl-CoA synthetase (AMP-forming)/AMP-acid ligase II
LSKTITQVHHAPTGRRGGSRVFSQLEELLAYYGRTAGSRNAILAPSRAPVTYAGLRVRAKGVVRRLRKLGVRRSDRVAVVLPEGPETAVATVAVATAAVCVPLNPSFTADEWQRYFGDLQVAALLTRADMDSASRSVAHRLGIPVIDLSPRLGRGPDSFDLFGSGTRRAARAKVAPSASDDAFILLTSGTTSRPKVVPLTQASVCLSAYNAGAVLQLGPKDRLLNVLPLYHAHGLISGLLTALAAGSTVVCAPGFDPDAFFGWLTEFRPTWYTAVPAIHRALLSVADRHEHSVRRCSVRVIRSASASLPPDVLHELESLFGVPVIETYGMTEAASQIAANPLGRRKAGSVGQPAGAEIAIMDGGGQRLPAGERGEVVLRGPTITRGYENDAAATRCAFRDGWFRTGDLGYLDRDGYLFIVGRIKDLINRGGQKVAPADVEEALLSHPDVIEAAAFSIPHKRLGEDVAAAVVLRPDAKVSAQKLRNFARECLARFKVPGLIRIVPEIPKSPGGKIKRGGLAAALSITLSTVRVEHGGKMAPPRLELEWQLTNIWADLLEFNQIGIDEDVFALGADSITVTQMLSRLRTHFGVDYSFKDILDSPTVAALAARIESWQRNPAAASRGMRIRPIRIAKVEEDCPQQASIVQELMLRMERELPGLPQFNLFFAYQLHGPLNVPALERSLAEVMRRHDSLRTGFAWAAKRPIALIAAAQDIDSPLVVEDLAACAPIGDGPAKALLLKKLELEAEQEALKPFDLNHAPLLRARLWRLGADEHVLLLILHHIIVDGWSVGIFMEEVSQLYAAFTAGRQTRLPELPLQFSDFVGWQRRWSESGAAARQFAYWKGRLRGVPPVFPTNGEVAGGLLAAPVAQEPVHVSNDLVARLSALSHSRGATLFMTLLTGFKALLLARSGRNDICVATSMANRSQLNTERVIGLFENTTLIRTRIDADLSFRQALTRVRDSVLEAYARQDLPFEILARRLAREDGLDPASLIQVFFVLQNAFRPLELPGLAVRPFAYPEGHPIMPVDRTWLTMMLKQTSSGITGLCCYKNDLFEPNAVQNWIADYNMILAKAAANPETSLGRLAGC